MKMLSFLFGKKKDKQRTCELRGKNVKYEREGVAVQNNYIHEPFKRHSSDRRSIEVDVSSLPKEYQGVGKKYPKGPKSCPLGETDYYEEDRRRYLRMPKDTKKDDLKSHQRQKPASSDYSSMEMTPKQRRQRSRVQWQGDSDEFPMEEHGHHKNANYQQWYEERNARQETAVAQLQKELRQKEKSSMTLIAQIEHLSRENERLKGKNYRLQQCYQGLQAEMQQQQRSQLLLARQPTLDSCTVYRSQETPSAPHSSSLLNASLFTVSPSLQPPADFSLYGTNLHATPSTGRDDSGEETQHSNERLIASGFPFSVERPRTGHASSMSSLLLADDFVLTEESGTSSLLFFTRSPRRTASQPVLSPRSSKASS